MVYIQCKSCYLLGSLLVDSGGRHDTAGAQRFSAAAIFGDSEALFAPLSVSFGMKRAAPTEKPTRILGARAKAQNTTTQQGCHSKSLRPRGATRREKESAGRPQPASRRQRQAASF